MRGRGQRAVEAPGHAAPLRGVEVVGRRAWGEWQWGWVGGGRLRAALCLHGSPATRASGDGLGEAPCGWGWWGAPCGWVW